MSEESTEFRKPTADEMRLISTLVARSPEERLDQDWAEHLLVAPMSDGGMGSLRLSPSGATLSRRELGRIVAELEFLDADGVLVLASLSTDRDGGLLELDIWKTDFSSLIRIPVDLG